MLKNHLLIPIVYLAFAWQAALRPDIGWHGYSPNFLLLALIAVLWSLSDSVALVAVAVVGLLSDSLAASQLGCDTLCFLAVAMAVQTFCPPKLVRHPALLLVLVLLSTVLIEFSSTALRVTLNHDLATPDAVSASYLRWILTAIGDGFYTALLAVLPLTGIHLWNSQVSRNEGRSVGNRWHRLTG